MPAACDGKMTLQLLKMVVNQKRNACVTSVHLKFGVALAFSAGGIIYAFLAIKRSKRSENVDNNGSNPSLGNLINFLYSAINHVLLARGINYIVRDVIGNENKSDARGENNGDEELRQQDIALLVINHIYLLIPMFDLMLYSYSCHVNCDGLDLVSNRIRLFGEFFHMVR